jgi:hypothetical protein
VQVGMGVPEEDELDELPEEVDEDEELDVEDDVDPDELELTPELLLVDDSPDDELSPDDWPPEALPELLLAAPLDDELAFVSVPAEGNSMPQATAPIKKVHPANRPARKERICILRLYQNTNGLPALVFAFNRRLGHDPNHTRHRTRVWAAGVSVGALFVELRRNHFLFGIEGERVAAVLHHVVVHEQVT